ncbi:copper amine oxidase N-terminal domain-containing protein [Ammoniphilus sp. YIM 78166]|uniref:copper amine oxidase N-terminal domain-containing protein n=1 Tax=Ammoniphilus sp. YIM 78166 TaxID=1644106 RepID=UPI001F0DBF7F|nr:copper amine oxidase N-terminal domain-containing protein [Ammoniphilus sp. YIM 78166]
MRYFTCFVCAGMLVMPVFATPQVQVEVDGQRVAFPDAQPYIDPRNGRTMVPVRFIAESFGAAVQWDGAARQVTFNHQGQTMNLVVGQNYALVNGKMVRFDAPAVVRNDRTIVPLRFISEMFGARVGWLGERQLVVITTGSVREQKGTWIWDARTIDKQQDNILTFAADNRVTVFYLHIDRDVHAKTYQEFIRRANERGIQVEALAGRPQWALRDHQAHIHEWITWVKKYNASVDPSERFQGLHFDIEPYVLKEWKTENQRVIQQWMDNMRFIEKETRDMGLRITVDLPFWIYKSYIPDSRDYTLSAWLLEKTDRVVIMDYRNFALGANGMVVHGLPILKEAAVQGKEVVIAVETKPSKEGDHTTFYSLSVEAMEKELELAREAFSLYSSFAGFAIHDFQYWRALDKKGGMEQ